MKSGLVLASLLVFGGCDVIGGADTVVRGSGNVLGDDATVDRVAVRLVELGSVPEVTDDDLSRLYQAVYQRAMEGDLQSSLVVLRVAAIQRQPEESE